MPHPGPIDTPPHRVVQLSALTSTPSCQPLTCCLFTSGLQKWDCHPLWSLNLPQSSFTCGPLWRQRPLGSACKAGDFCWEDAQDPAEKATAGWHWPWAPLSALAECASADFLLPSSLTVALLKSHPQLSASLPLTILPVEQEIRSSEL